VKTLFIILLGLSYSYAVSYQDTLSEEKKDYKGQYMTYAEAVEYETEILKNKKMTICVGNGKNRSCGETTAYCFYVGACGENKKSLEFKVITQSGTKDLFNE
jgi:hypothetical protein